MRVNVFGVMVGCQRAARHMAEHGGGSIINTTSIGGINAGAGLMTYRATKAAVIHLTRCDRHRRSADTASGSTASRPAHIPTAINAAYDQSSDRAAHAAAAAPGLAGRRRRTRSLYLASDRAAQVTGIVLPVDGGTTAGPPRRAAKISSRRPRRSSDAR